MWLIIRQLCQGRSFQLTTSKCACLRSKWSPKPLFQTMKYSSSPVSNWLFKVQTNLRIFSRQSSRKSQQGQKLPYEINANVAKDVIIYSHKNNRFYQILTVFGAVQLVFWSYLSYFSFTNLRDMPKEQEDKHLGIQRQESGKWYAKLSLGDGVYKNGIGVLCFSVGYLVFFVSWMYPLRAVHKVKLLRGGNSLQMTTYAWFGKTRSFSVPLNQVTCLQSRTSSATQIPMKIKGKWFFFLLDKKGTFHQPKLFDYTVGLMRNIK